MTCNSQCSPFDVNSQWIPSCSMSMMSHLSLGKPKAVCSIMVVRTCIQILGVMRYMYIWYICVYYIIFTFIFTFIFIFTVIYIILYYSISYYIISYYIISYYIILLYIIIYYIISYHIISYCIISYICNYMYAIYDMRYETSVILGQAAARHCQRTPPSGWA